MLKTSYDNQSDIIYRTPLVTFPENLYIFSLTDDTKVHYDDEKSQIECAK